MVYSDFVEEATITRSILHNKEEALRKTCKKNLIFPKVVFPEDDGCVVDDVNLDADVNLEQDPTLVMITYLPLSKLV